MNRPPTRASSRAQLSSHGSADASIGAGVSSSTTSTKVSGTKRAFADAAAVPNEHAVINIDNDDDKDNNSSNNNGDDASTASTASRAAAVPSGVNPEDANSCAVCLDRVIEQGLLDSCAHVFCFSCAKKWSESENTCPLCKQRFHSIVRVDLSNPNQKRRAEKIRVAQRNQSSRTNAAALLAPGMFLSSHMRAIVRLLWPGLAGNSITNAQNMRVGASLARETIDVDAAPPPPLVPPPPPLPLPRLVRAAVEPPQIIDLTELDSSDDEEANAGAASSAGSSVVPTIDLTLDDDDDDDHDRHDDNAPHDDIVAIPLVSQ